MANPIEYVPLEGYHFGPPTVGHTAEIPPSPAPLPDPRGELLDSWKEIAAHLNRSERTVRRWEATEGLPVHRHRHLKRGTVHAYKPEIDAWWKERGSLLEKAPDIARPDGSGTFLRGRGGRLAIFAAILIVLVSLAITLKQLRKDAPKQFVPRIQSVAVLPLRNLSADPDQEYFADGMTEALITELARIEQLKVISRTSVMRYKNVQAPITKIAAELGVDAIVEGAAAREGNRVRITVQLIDGVTDTHLWASTYEQELASVLAVQKAAARGIADGIRVQLLPPQRASLEGGRRVNPEAYDAYLRGMFFLDKVTREGITRGIQSLHRSINTDPGFPPAYVGLADGYNRSAIRGYLPPREAYPLARAAAQRAVQLDDTLAEAHALLGVISFRFDWDWAAAERELSRALQLSPNSSRVRLSHATYLLARGKVEDAITEGRRALELDPLSPQRNADLSAKLMYGRQYDEALHRIEKTLELAPDLASGYAKRASLYAVKGKYAEALADCDRAFELAPQEQLSLVYCGFVYRHVGTPKKSMQMARRLKQLSSSVYVDAYYLALLYGGIGQTEQALLWLRRAHDTRSANLCFLAVDLSSGKLGDDPRFKAFLDQIKRSQ